MPYSKCWPEWTVGKSLHHSYDGVDLEYKRKP
jgi:hypothetical protein